MKTTLDMIEVMQAFADGKAIERTGGFGEWVTADRPCEWVAAGKPWWNWADYNYRIAEKKPVLVAHWPAVTRTLQGHYMLSDGIFATAEVAVRFYAPGMRVVRLATELPPIMLEVES